MGFHVNQSFVVYVERLETMHFGQRANIQFHNTRYNQTWNPKNRVAGIDEVAMIQILRTLQSDRKTGQQNMFANKYTILGWWTAYLLSQFKPLYLIATG